LCGLIIKIIIIIIIININAQLLRTDINDDDDDDVSERRTFDGENELISAIIELSSIDGVAIYPFNAVLLHQVGGQSFLERGSRDDLGQLHERSAHYSRHSTAKSDVAADRHQSRVDDETGDGVLLYAVVTCRRITCPLTCPGVTSSTANIKALSITT